jgi:ABC-type enterobactin transport system permease subunit
MTAPRRTTRVRGNLGGRRTSWLAVVAAVVVGAALAVTTLMLTAPQPVPVPVPDTIVFPAPSSTAATTPTVVIPTDTAAPLNQAATCVQEYLATHGYTEAAYRSGFDGAEATAILGTATRECAKAQAGPTPGGG